MYRQQAALALLGVLLTLVAMVPPSGAQTGGSRQVITGQTVRWTGEWSPVPEVSVADANVELFALRREASIVGYGGTSFPVGANEVRDVLLKGFASGQDVQPVDRGAYDNVSYSIDLSTIDGNTLATFALVIENPTNTTMALLITAPATFEASMTAAQAGVTIDGAPIFDGVDAAQMQATILAAQDAAAGAATPAPSAAPGGEIGDPGNASDASATPAAGGQSGATLPNAVTVASSGVEIQHSADWAVQRQDETSVTLGMAGPPAVLVSVLDLGPVGGAVDPSALATGLTQQVESLADAEVVAALNPSPDRIVVVFRDPDASGELYRIYDIALDPNATTAVTMIVGVDDLDAGLTIVTETVRVDGRPIMADVRSLVPELFSAA